MIRVYNYLKLKMQDNLQWGKTNSLSLAQVKSTNALSLNNEMEGLERFVDRIGKLKAAVRAGEAMVIEEARQAEQLAGNLKADIAALEAKLKEMEETIRRKDSSRQKMEETLNDEIKNLQNDVKKKDETLATRGNEINDYKSKIDDNRKQIGELELANRKTTEEAASHAKRAEDVAETSQAKITVFESHLKVTEKLARQKESTIKELEQKLAAKVQEFESMAKDKRELVTRRDAEISDLKSKIDDNRKQIGELELANRKTTEEAASHAKRAEDVAETSRAKITALESQLNETEKLTQQKESSIKEVEQKLAAKVQEFESMVKDKELLIRRDAEISDLKSQLKRLPKGIGQISSFFRQAEALSGIEGQDVSTAAQNEPVDEVEEKPVAVQSNIARVTLIVPAAEVEMVSPEIFQRIISELVQVTNVMAPVASLIVRQQAKALGESVEKFPRTRLPELLEGLAKEISDDGNRQIDFRQRLAQSAQIILN